MLKRFLRFFTGMMIGGFLATTLTQSMFKEHYEKIIREETLKSDALLGYIDKKEKGISLVRYTGGTIAICHSVSELIQSNCEKIN